MTDKRAPETSVGDGSTHNHWGKDKDLKSTEEHPGSAAADGGRAWYMLGLLTFCYALAYVDRQLVNLLVDDIRGTYALSDTQISYIIGLGFALAYLIAAPVYGRFVDITNRRNLLVVSVVLWSLSTAAFGLVDSYWGLFAARVGVGISEAGVLPIAWSLLADTFSRKKLPTALSIFASGQKLGSGLSLIAGGLVISFADAVHIHFPSLRGFETWQFAFLIIGLPGVVIGLLLFTFPEPVRGQLQPATQVRDYTMRESWAYIWERRRFYGRIYASIGMLGILVLGLPAWVPAFLIRRHGETSGEVGLTVGAIFLIFGVAGVLSGPIAVRWFERRGYVDGTIRASAWAMMGIFLFAAAIPFAPGAAGAMAAIAGTTFCFTFPTGIIPSAVQTGTPNRIRGFAGSLYTFSAQLVGFGVGPTAIALITDHVFGDSRMVGFSIAIVGCTAAILGGWLLASAIQPFREMLAEAESLSPDS
ncbi:MAG: MFS transporter [Sphingobium sp.]